MNFAVDDSPVGAPTIRSPLPRCGWSIVAPAVNIARSRIPKIQKGAADFMKPASKMHSLPIFILIASLYWSHSSIQAHAQTASGADTNSRESAAQTPPIATDCDRYAASDFDRQSPTPGIPFNKIDAKIAIPACVEALSRDPTSTRLTYQLGRAYDADRDFANALNLFLIAARANFALAQVNLGTLYFNGQGVEKNYKEAARWNRLAAEQGLAPAQNALASLYAHGLGVDQDYAEAARLYRLAAEQGFGPAEVSLGALYANGQGLARNYSQAMKWYGLAADQGYQAGQTSLNELNATGQTNAQIAEIKSDPPTPTSLSLKPAANARYVEAPAGAGSPPVKITVKPEDAASRAPTLAIEVSALAPNFSLAGFAVNKGECRVFIEDPSPLLAKNAGASAPDATQSGGDSAGAQADFARISLRAPPFDPPVVAKLGQYMTFYIDPSACDLREVEVLVNGLEWRWTPG
jgi:TPR repeat protein